MDVTTLAMNRLRTREGDDVRLGARPFWTVMLTCAVAFGASACASRTPAALSPVAAPPAQPLPAWIASVSPKGIAPDGAQIRIVFAHDVLAAESLESPERARLLAHCSIDPPLPGRFELLTPRMIGFMADAAIPHATRVVVRLSVGFGDLARHTLARDVAWSFTTEPLTFANLPEAGPSATPAPLGPTLEFDASDAVDAASLVAHVRVVPPGGGAPIPVQLAASPSPDASAEQTDTPDANGADSADSTVHYRVVPIANLAAATTYGLRIDPGIAPLRGNLASSQTYRAQFTTHGALAFTGAGMSGEPQKRFANGEPLLTFSNAIDEDSAKRHVAIDPRPARGLPLLRADDRGFVTLDDDALAPQTTYRVTIGAGLADAYGETLGRDVTASFTTGNLAPAIWAPTGLSIFPAGLSLALDVDTTNLPERGYRAAYRVLTPADLIERDPADQNDLAALIPPPPQWPRRAFGQPLDETVSAAIPLRSLLGARTGLVAYGVTARTSSASDWKLSDETTYLGAVELSNIGVFAQWFPGGAIVRAARLSDGAPIAGARVALYALPDAETSTGTSPDEDACASGTTARDGSMTIGAAAFGACANAPHEPGDAPQLMAVVRYGNDWAYARCPRYFDGYAYGLPAAGWSAGTPAALGSLVTDRTLYQPGERGRILGVTYFERNGAIVRGSSTQYDVTAIAPSGAKHRLGSFAPDAFGAFSLPFSTAANAEVGDWTLEARGTGGELLDGDFRVAEFTPPNFAVDLHVDRDPAVAGSSVIASSTSRYLFGAPLAGATTHLVVTRAPAPFVPAGYDAYAFGRQWTYPEEMPSVSSDVVQSDLRLDAGGGATQSIDVARDLPYAMQYTVSTTTNDVSNRSVSANQTFLALPGEAAIGLHTAFVAAAGSPLDVSTIVVDPSGAALAGREVRLTLQRRVEDDAVQIENGSETPARDVHYVDVAGFSVVSQNTPVRARFTPSQPGDYRIRAKFAGAPDDRTASDVPVWVSGRGAAAWATPDVQLAVKLDKARYRPGDVATALVESPFAQADLDLSVVRNGVLFTRRLHVRGGAPVVRFTVTPAMLPNAAVEAFLVRRGPALTATVPRDLMHLSRLGFAPFDVSYDAKVLKLSIAAKRPVLGPVARQTIAIRVTGRSGEPARAEIVLAVVNDAILQLSHYRFPDLAAQIYAGEPISTRFADNRERVLVHAPHDERDKGFGFGGGAMAGPADTHVRTKFVPLAYWNAHVRTDARGRATVSFALPDDLTTWRVMAVALGKDARFGIGDATFVTSKPLVTNPLLPQFARPGDRFAAGVSALATHGATGSLAVSAKLTGGAVFAANDPHAASTSAPLAGTAQAVRFDASVATGRAATFTFRSQLGSVADAFSVSLPVVTSAAYETVVTSGSTRAAASVPIELAPSLAEGGGNLRVAMSSTLLGDLDAPLDVLDEPADGFASELAARIAIGSDAILLDRRYGRPAAVAPLRARVRADVEALGALALPSGAFANWPGDATGDPQTTAFDLVRLHAAARAGIDVAPLESGARRYLRGALADPRAAECNDAACMRAVRLSALWALAAAGDPREQFVSDLVRDRAKLTIDERIRLARFLLRLGDWHTVALQLRDDVLRQTYLSGRYATLDARGALDTSATVAQAQMLALAVESGMSGDDVDGLLAQLLAARHDGTWGDAADDAEALDAVVAYAGRDVPAPNFHAIATLPALPPKILRAHFTGFAKTLAVAALPLDEVTRGRSTVSFLKTGPGTLRYAVTLRYRAPQRSGTYAGLRIDRIVRTAGASEMLATYGLAAPEADLTLAAAGVFDVEDRIATDHPVDDVLVTDPLPAGLEAVDQSLRTASAADLEGVDTVTADDQATYRDRVVSFFAHLDAGAYAIHYLVRSVTPGTFGWPGASAVLQYAPEQFGRTTSATLVVR